jgi:hypothetical protein
VAQCFINGEWNVQASARLSPQGQQEMMPLPEKKELKPVL